MRDNQARDDRENQMEEAVDKLVLQIALLREVVKVLDKVVDAIPSLTPQE